MSIQITIVNFSLMNFITENNLIDACHVLFVFTWIIRSDLKEEKKNKQTSRVEFILLDL